MTFTLAECRLYIKTGMTMIDILDDPTQITAAHIDLAGARLNTTANLGEMYIDYPVHQPDDSLAPIYLVDYCRVGIAGSYFYYYVIPTETVRLSARTVHLSLILDSISTCINTGIEITGRLSRIHPDVTEDMWWASETDEQLGNRYPPKTTFQDIDLNPNNTWTQLIASTVNLIYPDTLSVEAFAETIGMGVGIPSNLWEPVTTETVIRLHTNMGPQTYVLGNMAIYNYKTIRDNRADASWRIDKGLTILQYTGNANALSDSYLVPSDYIEEAVPEPEVGLYPTLSSKYYNTQSGLSGYTQLISDQILTPLIPGYGFLESYGGPIDFQPDPAGTALMARLNDYMRGGCLKAFYMNVTHTIRSWGSGQSMTTTAANLRSSGENEQVATREFTGAVSPLYNKVAISLLSNPAPKGCLYIKYAQIWDVVPAHIGTQQWLPNPATGVSANMEQGITNAGWMSYSIALKGSPTYLSTAFQSYLGKADNNLARELYQAQIEASIIDTNRQIAQQATGGVQSLLSEKIANAMDMGLDFQDTGVSETGLLGRPQNAYINVGGTPNLIGIAYNMKNSIANLQEQKGINLYRSYLQDYKYTTDARMAKSKNYAVAGENGDATTALLCNMLIQLKCTFDDARDVLEHCRYFLMFGYSDGRTTLHKELKELIVGRRKYFCFVQYDYANVRIQAQLPSVHVTLQQDIEERLRNGVRIWNTQNVGAPDAARYFINNGFPNTNWNY